ncbi:MAG: hypothetical protein ACJA06_001503 [Halocynthiibacter sp.]|jgi:hypothetical protein
MSIFAKKKLWVAFGPLVWGGRLALGLAPLRKRFDLAPRGYSCCSEVRL